MQWGTVHLRNVAWGIVGIVVSFRIIAISVTTNLKQSGAHAAVWGLADAEVAIGPVLNVRLATLVAHVAFRLHLAAPHGTVQQRELATTVVLRQNGTWPSIFGCAMASVGAKKCNCR